MTEITDLSSLFSLESPLPPPTIPTAPSESAREFMQQIHRKNSELLKGIIQERGWPDDQEEEGNAIAAAFIIALHADYDLPLQRQCHALMMDAYARGQHIPLGFIAFLTDRILSNEGHHQRFGTQIREVNNGCFVPKPMEDPDRVDELREQVQLHESLSEYFQRVNDGDLMLYRRLLGEYANKLEEIRSNKVIPFPKKPEQPH